MKLAALLLLTALLQLSIPGESQTVNFTGKDVSLKEAISIIKTQTGVLFFYDAVILADGKPVTVSWKNVPLTTALNELFKDQPLAWMMEGKTVTIIRRSLPAASSPPITLKNQTLVLVKGTVTDLSDDPISGVSVMVKGTNRGTISDSAGAFSLMAEPKNKLLISAISYMSKEVKVEGLEMNIKLQLEIKPMEASLAGGNLTVMKRKSITTSVTVLDAKTLEKIPGNTIDQIFRGWVPGTNNFNVGDAPEGFPSLSIRGAIGPTSLSFIAVYIDGVEYAGGSAYLSQLDKNNIERVEIVRGPGAATMYGTGSNGGIVQIFTKKARPGQTTVNFTTSAGFYKSKWVKKDPFQQVHNLETTTGFKTVALTMGASYRTVGAYLPNGGEKNKGFYGSAKFDFGKLQANLSARYNIRNHHRSRNPYFDTAVNPRKDILIPTGRDMTIPAYEFYSVRPTSPLNKDGITETAIAGLHLSHKTTSHWVNNLDAGFTVNEYGEIPVPTGGTPLQRQYSSEEKKITTVRYSNVLYIEKTNKGLSLSITSGAEYKNYGAAKAITRAMVTGTVLNKVPNNKNYGAFVQLNPTFRNVYLTLGMRYEKNEIFREAWNPRAGITTNFNVGSTTIKPRISWGRGITSPEYEHRYGTPGNTITIVVGNPAIKPQSQQGFDYGVEVYDKHGRYSFEAVYYDNIFKDMFTEEDLGKYIHDTSLHAFRYSNVAKLSNRGWEFSGGYEIGRFSMKGTYSIMNATMEDTTGAYHFIQLAGKPPGSRMRNLPRHTAGFYLGYEFSRLFRKADKGMVSVNVTLLNGIVTADVYKYYLDIAYGRIRYTPGGSPSEIVTSPVYRVGLYADYHVRNDLRFFVQGANILNDYQYEYNSAISTHGATWLFGFKYHFSKQE